MGRRIHRHRPLAIFASAVLCATVLAPATVSAGVGAAPIITPVVSPASPNGANGWYTSDVDVSFSIDFQGQANPSTGADCALISITADGVVTRTCTASSDGGSAVPETVTIERDATDPDLAPEITPATLVRNGPGDAMPGATDATSGVDTKSCDAIDTTSVGTFSVDCRATDFAGNQATESVPYTVEPNGPAADVAATRGDGQVAYVTRQFASALVLTVTDAQGNPVPGETVSFHAPRSGASADLSRPSDVTNANGIASVRAFANNKAGGYVVRGKVPGAGAARFRLRNAPAPYFADGFSRGLRKWKRTGNVSIAKGAGQPAPSALLRASAGKTFATHRFGDTYATACASASVRLGSLGNEAVALLRFRGAGDSGISRVSVESDRELFVRNDRVGGVKLSGQRLPLGAWHELELCTHVGGKGSISLFLDGSKILSWRQRLGERRIAALHLIENDVKTFSVNVDNVLVDGKPGISRVTQRSLLMIMARDFASRLATAVFLVDPEGTLVYFNEAAERVLGQPFVEGRSVPAREWSTTFTPEDEDGRPVPLASLPLGVALTEHTPAHKAIRITGADGVSRAIEVTAFPLFAHADECVGAVAIFWEHPGH